MKLSSRTFLLSTCVAAALTACGGGTEDTAPTSPTPPTPTPTPTATATGTVSTTTTGVQQIATGTGAKIIVSEGAVPPTAAGTPGTIAFSVERNTSAAVTPPAGVTRGGDVYRFGPGGTTFSRPISVSLPVTGNFNQDELVMYRVNPTTGVPEPVPAVYDPATRTLTAQTYQLSDWFWGSRTANDTANGCLKVDNGTSNMWRTVVTQTYTMKYPNTDTEFRGGSATFARQGTIGWTSVGDWYLPQGTYQMCVEGDVNGQPRRSAPIPVTIDKPWRYDTRVCTNLGIASVALSEPGRCSQSPVPTPSVGTGELQVSLSWYSNVAVDLDLHVAEPGGEYIYYSNKTSASGGRLDRDNSCSNYINGQSENIYWTNPPRGQYTIQVNLYSMCGLGTTSMPFSVRVVNKGVTTTYTGTATLSGAARQTVATITVN